MDPIDMEVERLRLEIWEANHEMEITRMANPFSYGEGGVSRYAQRSPLPSGDEERE